MTENVFASPSTSQESKGIKAWSWINRPPKEVAFTSLLSLARTHLRVRLSAIDETSLASEHQKKIYGAVTEMLKKPTEASAIKEDRGWDEIYEVESLLALLYNGEQLRQEIGACLQDLTNLNQTEAATLRPGCEELLKRPADGSNPKTDDAMLSACLLRLMEAVHWSEKKKYLVRDLHVQATRRILYGLMVSFVVLILPYLAIHLDYESDFGSVSTWWTLLSLWTALTSGLFGAFFFRLTDINNSSIATSVDAAVLQRKWSYTLLRAGVGLCGALVVYIFLRSGIAEGALFPKFDEISIQLVNVAAIDTEPKSIHTVGMSVAMPSKALALLMFWCFLAGYSEKLVPSILGSAEQKLTETATRSEAR